LCKTLQVKHLKRWTVRSLLRADFFYRALPWTELILRRRQVPNDLNLRLSSRLSTLLVYAIPGAILGIGWWPGFLIIAGALVLALLALNAPLYRFFLERRGLGFVCRAIPWHWLYFAYSGLAFAVGCTALLWGQRSAPSAPSAVHKEWFSAEP
jgi:hypothetical protein